MMGSGGVGRGSKVVERRNGLRVGVGINGIAVVVVAVVVEGVEVVDAVVVAQSGLVLRGMVVGVLHNERDGRSYLNQSSTVQMATFTFTTTVTCFLGAERLSLP